MAMVLIKGAAGILGNSYALIADAIESASDVLTSFIVWIGLKAASKEPDADHPYGHGKAEPLAAIVVAVALVGAAILISIQSVEHILTPHKIPAPFTLIVLGIIIVVKEGLYRYSHKVGTEMESTAVKADAWHHRADAITSLTAFIGISIALIGGKGYETADDWAALIAAFIILLGGIALMRPAIADLMDRAPGRDLILKVEDTAASVEGVCAVEKTMARRA